MTQVKHADLVTQDMEQIAGLISRTYNEHKARTRRIPETDPDASIQAAVAGDLRAGFLRTVGVEYEAVLADVTEHLMGIVAIEGCGEMTAGRVHHRFTRGEAFITPHGRPHTARMQGTTGAVLQIPMSVVRQLAETYSGLPAADLRFTSMAPVSEAAGAVFARTVAFGCHELIDSRILEISPLIAQQMTWLTAAAFLTSFPSTITTLGYVRGSGWVGPATVRRAAAFIHANAEQPITLDNIAAAAGVTGRTLQYAFRRYCDTSPAGYLRKVRLDHARRELSAASPGDGVTVAAVARKWGWANPAHFAAAYRRQHGEPPGQTLRT